MTISEAPFPFESRYLHVNLLFQLVKENLDFAKAIVYLATYEKHKKLDVIAFKHSIKISNKNVTVAIVLYVGFEKNEYLDFKEDRNLHLITFSDVIPFMIEFKKLNIKHVDKLAWLLRILQESNNKKLMKINQIKTLKID